MSLLKNNTENDISSYHGNSTEEPDNPLNNATSSSTFQSTLLSLWSSLTTKLGETTNSTPPTAISTDTPSYSHNTKSTLSAGLKLTVLVTKPNNKSSSSGPSISPVTSPTSSKPSTSSQTSSTPSLPVSKLPKWRKRLTLLNTTTTTHVTTTQPHVTTQSLSTFRRTTLTTTTTIVPTPEDNQVVPSTRDTTTASPQTVTSIKVTENFSNVTYVTRDVVEGVTVPGNSTVNPQVSSENPNKASGYSQSIITPLVTPLMSFPVKGGENHSEKQSGKHPESKTVSNNRVGANNQDRDNRPISYWKPKGHSPVHINEALLNNNATNSQGVLPGTINKGDKGDPQMGDAPAPPDDLRELLPEMTNDFPVAEPLIHRPYDIPVLVSSSTEASSTSSPSSSSVSSSTASPSSNTASSTVELSSSTLTSSTSPASSSSQSSSLPSSVSDLLTILPSSSEPTVSAISSSTTEENPLAVPKRSSANPVLSSKSFVPPSESSSTLTSSLDPSTSQMSSTTQSSTIPLNLSTSSSKPIYTEFLLSFTNRPTISSSKMATQPTESTTNEKTISVTSTLPTTKSTEGHPSSTSQSKASLESTETLLTTLKHSVAQIQGAEKTKSSEGQTTTASNRPSAVNFTEPPIGDFLGPKPSNDPLKEEGIGSVDMVSNGTAPRRSTSDQVPLPSSPSSSTTTKKLLEVAKPTVFATTPVNITLEKMVVGPVSKPSNTNMAAIVVPVLLVMIMAGVGAFFFFRKRSRLSRSHHKSRKESLDATTPLSVDLEQCSPIDAGPVYARVDLSKKKSKSFGKGDYTAVQFHERPLIEETLLSDSEERPNRRDRNGTSEESLAPRDGLRAYFAENDLKIEDERSLESSAGADSSDNFDYMDSGNYTPEGVQEANGDSGAILDQTCDSPLRLPLLSPPIPFHLPHSDTELTSDSDFEEVQSPDTSELFRNSVLEDYSEPTPTPPRQRPAIRPHFYDQVYIPRSAINNFVDSANYVKGRKRSDSVQTNPYEEIGPAGVIGGATGRGPVPSTSGLGRGMAIYATVDETRMDARQYAIPRFTRSYRRACTSPPDMSPEELSNYGNHGASASPTLGPLLPTKRANQAFRGPPLLLSRRSRRRRTRSLPPRSRRDNPPSLPDRPPTPRSHRPARGEKSRNRMIPDYVTSRSLDLLDSGCCDIDLDVLVPPADDLNPNRLVLPPALPERSQLTKSSKPVPIRDRPLPDPEEKKEKRPIPNRTSTTARTTDLDRMATYDVDLDSIVPPSREDLEDSFAPLIWLTSPEPRYSGLLHSGIDKDDAVHQYTSLEAIPGSASRGNLRRPRPNSLSSSKSDGHIDRSSATSVVGQYLDINIAAFTTNSVQLPTVGASNDQRENRSSNYASTYGTRRDPIYESVGNPSREN